MLKFLSADFFTIILGVFFFSKYIQKHYQSVKQFWCRSGPTERPDLGPNCLQKLSADDKESTSDLTLDWLQSLKQFFINVLVARLTLMALF